MECYFPQEINERFILTRDYHKPLILCYIVKNYGNKIICFAKSMREAHRLSYLVSYLNPFCSIEEYTLNMSSNQREKILNNFKEGAIDM